MYYAYYRSYRTQAWRFSPLRSDQCATSDRPLMGGEPLCPALGRTPSLSRSLS